MMLKSSLLTRLGAAKPREKLIAWQHIHPVSMIRTSTLEGRMALAMASSSPKNKRRAQI